MPEPTEGKKAHDIAMDLTREQWFVLLGPRKFGAPARASDLVHGLRARGLLLSADDGGAWPLTSLGLLVIEARRAMSRSALAQKAKDAFEASCARRENASLAELDKMSDTWDDVITAVYAEMYDAITSARRP